jgi:hypothetical protein
MMIALLLSAALDATAPETPRALAVVAELERRAATAALWPGFEPGRTPLALYDGERTWLIRHPQPPAGFAPFPGVAGASWSPGRHPAVFANSSSEVAGVAVATVLLENKLDMPLEVLAGLVAHEAFHEFQGRLHRDWASANEVDLFTYPTDDAELLALRRLESSALRAALAAEDEAKALRWTLAALRRREERFRKMSGNAAAYEQGNELKEGLAQYVEDRLSGVSPLKRWSDAEFPAEDVRQRGYASGQAFALLLDRFAAGWKQSLDAKIMFLDSQLEAALRGRGGEPEVVTPAEQDAARKRAQEDVEKLSAQRSAHRAEFLAQKGWTLVVAAAAAAPLQPQGFDPWNVQRVAQGEVLHTRFLRLGNSAGNIEVIDHASLTEAAGAHPLFEGIRRVTVTGLPAEPALTAGADGTLTLAAPGLNGTLRGARVARDGTTITLQLGAGTP